MITRFDLVAGPLRAAEIINAYRKRLEHEDLLDAHDALNVACTAFAFGNIYIALAPGQVWERMERNDAGVAEFTIVGLEEDCHTGKHAICCDRWGVLNRISLTVLDEKYHLVRWPEEYEDRT
ncbi:hypothetical protein ACFYPT_42255 [Streptomyces sp. NPDC005529]|uniref:hypothetical protein n=1 Tax=unclassified Streptomyces TaxID=2593676 RepID=UPI0033A7242F